MTGNAVQKHEFENGKYTLVQDEQTGAVTVLRHGEPWREFVGDKFVHLLVSAFFEQRAAMIEALKEAAGAEDSPVTANTTALWSIEAVLAQALGAEVPTRTVPQSPSTFAELGAQVFNQG